MRNVDIDCKPFEIYSNDTIDQPVFMSFFGELGRVEKITIGTRFEDLLVVRPSEFGYNIQSVNQAFDFFKNLVPALNYHELRRAWKMYMRACKQRSFDTYYAYNNYMDGKKIKRLDRKGFVCQWVTA